MDLWVVEGRRSAGNTNVSQRRKEATRKEEKMKGCSEGAKCSGRENCRDGKH